jgi:hypothetical protein
MRDRFWRFWLVPVVLVAWGSGNYVESPREDSIDGEELAALVVGSGRFEFLKSFYTFKSVARCCDGLLDC